jgi:hypothetical protein
LTVSKPSINIYIFVKTKIQTEWEGIGLSAEATSVVAQCISIGGTMPVTELNHLLVRANDLETSRRFYFDVLGFEVMERPAFPRPGYCLDAAGKIQVH